LANTRDYNKAYYERHKVRRSATMRARQKQMRVLVAGIKLGRGCDKCGYNRCASALQFHHRGSDKISTIARMVASGNSLAAITAEIDKCALLCANCHTEVHEAEGWCRGPQIRNSEGV
jgi:hypothetical protein